MSKMYLAEIRGPDGAILWQRKPTVSAMPDDAAPVPEFDLNDFMATPDPQPAPEWVKQQEKERQAKENLRRIKEGLRKYLGNY